jgi:hypothetical protein
MSSSAAAAGPHPPHPPLHQASMGDYSSMHVLKSEIMWVLKTVTSHYSYKSNENTRDIFKFMFPDSTIAERFSMSERKCAYVACHGIYPYFKTQFRRKMGNEPYVLLFDESLNKHTQKKQLDIHVRLWDHDTVLTRFYGSSFIGHATAKDMLKSFNEDFDLNLANVFQLSMDGPNVNWSFYDILQKDIARETNRDCSMLNLGSCGLHILHNAFKSGVTATKWETSSILSSAYNLFKDAPARREDYETSSGTSVFPMKFCGHRFVFNLSLVVLSYQCVTLRN